MLSGCQPAPAAARPGALLALYLGLYAALRFVVEIFRGDALRGMVLSLDTPRLAARLGLAAREPLFLSVGQLGSLVIAAVLLTLARAAPASARKRPRLDLRLGQLAFGRRFDDDPAPDRQLEASRRSVRGADRHGQIQIAGSAQPAGRARVDAARRRARARR